MLNIESKPVFKLALCYICVTYGGNTDSYAPRFTQTYLANPGGYEHRLIIATNGGKLPPSIKNHFEGLDCEFWPHANDAGWDISTYQDFAEIVDADFLVCLGESCYFNRPGWLARMVEARLLHGPGMYGFFATHFPSAHLNTTAFGVDPDYLVRYPKVKNHPERYAFEHGESALWRRIRKENGKTIFVTWDRFLFPGEWRSIPNGLNTGDQSALMIRCNHTDRYDAANEMTRALWEKGANAPFR